MRAAALIGLGLLAGASATCSGPDDVSGWGTESCFPGNLRWVGGPGCAVAPADIAIDGESMNWDLVLPDATPQCVGCGAGDVEAMLPARTWESDIVYFLLWTNGPPVTDGTWRYEVVMRRIDVDDDDDARDYTFELTFDGTSFAGARIDQWTTTGLDIQGAFTPLGIELAVPARLLPFPGGAWVYTLVWDTVNQTWRSLPAYSTKVCWDALTPDGPCSEI